MGFLLGFVLTVVIYNGENSIIYALIVGFILAVIGSASSYKFYQAGLFLWALWMVYSFVQTIIPVENNTLKVIVGIVLGIIAAIFMAKFGYVWIIILTAVSGGFNAAGYGTSLFSFSQNWSVYVLGTALAAAGMFIQFLTVKNKRKYKNSKYPE